MSEDLKIKIDFTGVSAASGGIAILSPGLHTGTISEYARYENDSKNNGKLYCYMVTNGQRHRDRFDLDNSVSLPFLKAYLLSAGVPESKISGVSEVPFQMTIGRTVHFNYTPPQVDESGKAVMGSYAKYTFYTKERFDSMNVTNIEVDTEANGTATAPKNAPVTGDGDDYEFLLT